MMLSPLVTFLLVLVIGILAGTLFDRMVGPSWLARQFGGSTRIPVTSALVGIAGAFIGFHIVAVFMLSAVGTVGALVGAIIGALVVLWAWRTVN